MEKERNSQDAKWEYIGHRTWRRKLPNGWLIRSFETTSSSDGGRAVALLFIPFTHPADEKWEL